MPVMVGFPDVTVAGTNGGVPPHTPSIGSTTTTLNGELRGVGDVECSLWSAEWAVMITSSARKT